MAEATPLDLMGGLVYPDANVQPARLKQYASAANVNHGIVVFKNAGGRNPLQGSFIVPKGYNTSGPTFFQARWTADVASAVTAKQDVGYKTNVQGTDITGALTRDTDTLTEAKPAGALEEQISRVSVANPDDLAELMRVAFLFYLDVGQGTLADDYLLLALHFIYDVP